MTSLMESLVFLSIIKSFFKYSYDSRICRDSNFFWLYRDKWLEFGTHFSTNNMIFA